MFSNRDGHIANRHLTPRRRAPTTWGTLYPRTHLEQIITKAGHKPSPRLLQNHRTSCETGWVENYPAHVVRPVGETLAER